MKTEVEIAKLGNAIPQDEIEAVVIKLLENRKIQKNSIIYIPSQHFPELNKYKDHIHSVGVNDIDRSTPPTFYYYEFSQHCNPEMEYIEANSEENITVNNSHEIILYSILKNSYFRHLCTGFCQIGLNFMGSGNR